MLKFPNPSLSFSALFMGLALFRAVFFPHTLFYSDAGGFDTIWYVLFGFGVAQKCQPKAKMSHRNLWQ